MSAHQPDADVADGELSDADRLLVALSHEFGDQPGSFTTALERLLSEINLGDERFQKLQSTISQLRHELSTAASPELEDLWHRALRIVALTHTRRLEQRRLEDDQAYYRLMENGERFGSALDLPTLTTALAGSLLALGIRHAYVSRYPEATQSDLECFVAVRDGARYYPPRPRFIAQDLMPYDAFPQDRRSTFLAFPLTFDALQFGVAVFEAGSGLARQAIYQGYIGPSRSRGTET